MQCLLSITEALLFEAGIEAFEALVPKLAAGTVEAVDQDLSAKSYFGRYDRPANAAFLDISGDFF